MLSFEEFYFLKEDSFVDRPTHNTASKANVKNLQNIFINKYRQYPPGPDDLLYGVVGHPSGLQEHIDEADNLGYDKKQVRYFDRDKDTVQALRQQWNMLFPQEKSQGVNQIKHLTLSPLRSGYTDDVIQDQHVTHLDFDITSIAPFNPAGVVNTVLEFKAKYKKLQSMVYVFSQRSKKEANILVDILQPFLTGLNNNDINTIYGVANKFAFNKTSSKRAATDEYSIQLQRLLKDAKISSLVVPYAGRNNTAMLSVTVVFNPRQLASERESLLKRRVEITADAAITQLTPILGAEKASTLISELQNLA